MNSKNFVMLILWSSLAIALISLITYVTLNSKNIFFEYDFNKLKEEWIVKDESFDIDNKDNIEMNFISSDVRFLKSTDDKIRVVQYSFKDINKKYLFSANQSSTKLEINEEQKTFSIGFNYNRFAFVIYIPEKYQNVLNLKNVSGDIKVDTDLNIENLNIKSTSGDIESNSKIISKKMYIKNISGTIELKYLEAKENELKTTSGKIEINNLIAENNNISSISGRIEIADIEGSGSFTTTSGKIVFDKFDMTDDTRIKSISGKVEVTVLNTNNILMKTSSTSGKIKYPDDKNSIGNEPFNVLTISTTSGNIYINKTAK